MTDFLVGLIVYVFASLPIHELGHYLMGRKLGFKNMTLGLGKWHGIPWSLQVAGDFTLELPKDTKEFFKLYGDLVSFYAMGSIFSVVTLLFAQLFSIFSQDSLLLLVLLYMMYMFYEISSIPHSVKSEVSR